MAAGCGGGRGPVGLSANAAHFDTRIALSGASLRASGHNCSGIYGHWSVRLEVEGAVKGSGATDFTLASGKEATAPVSFPIRSGLLSGRATGLMRVAPQGNALVVRGRVRVNVPLRTVSRTIEERIPLERGPTPQCGVSG